MTRWTFKFAWAQDPNHWATSGQRFNSITEAARAAGDWMRECHENGSVVYVGLVEIKGEKE